MDKETLSNYGWVIIVIIIIAILIGLASPFAGFIKDMTLSTLGGLRTKQENVLDEIKEKTPPKYSKEEIEKNPLLFGIGATKLEYVVAEFSEDYKTVKIIKNGDVSDGKMLDWVNPTKPITLPMYQHRQQIETVIIEDGITHIGDYAFYACVAIKGPVQFPSSLQSIGNASFAGSSIQGPLNLNEGLVKIGNKAFFKCSKLNGVLAMPKTLKEIGRGAFEQNKALTKLELNNGLENIGDFAFSSCSGFKGDLNIPGSVKKIGISAFQLCSGFDGKLTFNEGLESIGDLAFNHCSCFSNTSLAIPSTVKAIGGDATVVVKSGTQIGGLSPNPSPQPYGSHTFYDFATKSIQEYVVAEGNASFKTHEGVLFTKNGERLLSYPASKEGSTYEIPEGVKYMDELSFSRTRLGSAKQPLKTLILPNSYEILTDNQALNVLNRGNSNSLANALYIFTSVENIIVKADNPKYKSIDGCVYSKDEKTLWYVPTCKSGDYIVNPGCETIMYGAFYEYGQKLNNHSITNLTSITIPASVKNMYVYDIDSLNKYIKLGGVINVDGANTVISVKDVSGVKTLCSESPINIPLYSTEIGDEFFSLHICN